MLPSQLMCQMDLQISHLPDGKGHLQIQISILNPLHAKILHDHAWVLASNLQCSSGQAYVAKLPLMFTWATHTNRNRRIIQNEGCLYILSHLKIPHDHRHDVLQISTNLHTLWFYLLEFEFHFRGALLIIRQLILRQLCLALPQLAVLSPPICM